MCPMANAYGRSVDILEQCTYFGVPNQVGPPIYLLIYLSGYLPKYLPTYLPTYQWTSYLPTSTKLALKLL
jgi:hypothetical protein